MNEIVRRSVLSLGLVLGLSSLAVLSGCATSGPAKPLPRDQVYGSKWKMVVAGGRMDHRVVLFEKKDGRLVGSLVEKGRVLSQIVGVNEGMEMFALSPAPNQPENTYEGIYRTVMSDGRANESQVTVQFFDDHFTWNLESASWARVE